MVGRVFVCGFVLHHLAQLLSRSTVCTGPLQQASCTQALTPRDACRARACAAMGECFAAAFNTARGAFVREALIAGYPRLAALLEDTAARLARDSDVKDADPALGEEQVGYMMSKQFNFLLRSWSLACLG